MSCGQVYTCLDKFRYWTVCLAILCAVASGIYYSDIPGSRDDHASRKHSLLCIWIASGVLGIGLSCLKYVGTGEDDKYGRRRLIGICLHVINLSCGLALIVSAIVLLVQIGRAVGPELKSELQECTNIQNEKGGLDAQLIQYCLSLTETPEPDSMEICDRIFEMDKITTGSGRSKHTRFATDHKYCLSTYAYHLNIFVGVLAIVTSLSYFVLQALIFNAMRDE